MSELIVIGNDDQGVATQAYNELMTLQKDFVVQLSKTGIGGELLKTSLSEEDGKELANELADVA